MKPNGFRSLPWRQVLWIGAGSVALTFLVAAASWLFTPRPDPDRIPAAKPVRESSVERRTFVPESPVPRADVLPTPPIEPAAPVDVPPGPPEPELGSFEEAPAPPPPAPPPRPQPEARPGGTPAGEAGLSVQLGAFGTLANARELSGRVKAMGFGAQVVSKDGRHKVLIPGFADREAAEKALQDLRRAGFSGAFVVAQE